MRRIREFYGVPCKRGGRVNFDGKPGRITQAVQGHHWLYVLLDSGQRVICHPTWRMEYL
jgi:hypothetical protein